MRVLIFHGYLLSGTGSNVYNSQLSPDGRRVLVEGVFTSVQGRSRQQIFMLNLGANHGNVSDWNSSEFSQHCATKHPFYIKAAAWSPDQATVYIATTGFRALTSAAFDGRAGRLDIWDVAQISPPVHVR